MLSELDSAQTESLKFSKHLASLMKRYTIANNFSCEYGQGQFNRMSVVTLIYEK